MWISCRIFSRFSSGFLYEFLLGIFRELLQRICQEFLQESIRSAPWNSSRIFFCHLLKGFLDWNSTISFNQKSLLTLQLQDFPVFSRRSFRDSSMNSFRDSPGISSEIPFRGFFRNVSQVSSRSLCCDSSGSSVRDFLRGLFQIPS